MSGVDKEDFRDSFFEECEELLEKTQDGLTAMADDPADADAINSVFRAVHSIKGGAGAFGLDALVQFAHKFETALDALRSGQVQLTDDLIDLFRHCGDKLADHVASARDGVVLEASQQLDERLQEISGDHGEEEVADFEPVTLNLDAFPEAENSLSRYTISVRAKPSLFAAGNEPAVLFSALRRLGEVDVRAALDAVPPLSDLEADDCAIAWEISLITDGAEDDIKDVFEFVEGSCELSIVLEGAHEANDPSRIGTPEGPTLSDLVPEVMPDLSVPSEEPAEPGTTSDHQPPNSGTRKGAMGKAPEPKAKSVSTIRVDLERIDKLINLVGELVIKEAMLSQSIDEQDIVRGSGVSTSLDSLKQIASEIQEAVMAIRAQPVKPLFQRMARIVREAASSTGKRVRFVTIGDYTEVDKTVIERLLDPLTHMIRNAVDHGLESPEARKAAGKPAEGTITLSAAHRSGRVLIEVVDDGGGIDRTVVRRIALERGLISEADVLSPNEIDNLLFMPGFSSKVEVSEMSGRGVGLDVVRSAIQKLGGRVAIHSDTGEGSTFSISLPLTLAVLEGMVVEVGGETMVVPISAVQETLRPNHDDLDLLGLDSVVLRNRGELVPVIDLGAYFGFRQSPAALEDHVLLLIASDQGPRYALVVDEIQDQRQVVIKSLEANYQQVNGVAAATILGDGRIALIIDADTITRELGTGNPGDKHMKLAG